MEGVPPVLHVPGARCLFRRLKLWSYSRSLDSSSITKKSPATGGGQVFSLDAISGLLAAVSASAPVLIFVSALCFCGVSCMI